MRKGNQNINKWTCQCCFKAQTISIFYACTAANRAYKKVAERNYLACSACVESAGQEGEVDSKSKESSDAKAFLFKKVRWTLDRISYTSTATMHSSPTYA